MAFGGSSMGNVSCRVSLRLRLFRAADRKTERSREQVICRGIFLRLDVAMPVALPGNREMGHRKRCERVMFWQKKTNEDLRSEILAVWLGKKLQLWSVVASG